jgi:hypothetical protein
MSQPISTGGSVRRARVGVGWHQSPSNCARLNVQWTNVLEQLVPQQEDLCRIIPSFFPHRFPQGYDHRCLKQRTAHGKYGASYLRGAVAIYQHDAFDVVLLEDKENDTPLFTFTRYMSKWQYVAITSVLRFTAKVLPLFGDRFLQVQEMIAVWNKNMWEKFSTGWALCLDESMSIWFRQWTCPG